MQIAWISISTKWSITSVQAALNVFISVLGTVGIWAFSRYWWQRGSQHVLNGKSEVPLSSMLILASPGEGYDAIKVLRKKVLSKEHWRLLFQIFIILLATAACMFAGPIAKVSLRLAKTIRSQNIEILATSKGTGFIGNRLDANVEWNDTIQSLNDANFPHDQLLDFLPSVLEPWTYKVQEWDPTWRATCDLHDEFPLSEVAATGNGTFMEPLKAFTKYRDTYDPSWLNTSNFRIQSDTNFEQLYIEGEGMLIKDALFWVLIQSEPTIEDRMYYNNDTLRFSISALHLRNFWLSPDEKDATQASLDDWVPYGPVESASFTRAECNFSRKSLVPDENMIPWIWTNDTWSITFAYRTYWMTEVGERSSKNLTVTIPSPEELFRFYQAYMISVNTWLSYPSQRRLSIWMDTVQVSTAILVLIILLTLLELWISGRYFWFLRNFKKQLRKMSIPDGRIEWMIHAAKMAAQDEEKEPSNLNGSDTKGKQESQLTDRDYLRQASFGNVSEQSVARPQLARVYTSSRTSFSSSVPNDRRSRSVPTKRRSRSVSTHKTPQIVVRTHAEAKTRPINPIDGAYIEKEKGSASGTFSTDVEDYEDGRMLSPTTSRGPFEGRSRASSRSGASCSRSSFCSIVPEDRNSPLAS